MNAGDKSQTISIKKPDADILREYFLAEDVEVIGTIKEPLFAVVDVAKKIKDDNYHRTIKGMDIEFVVERKHFRGGKMRMMKFFTEDGLYEYLFTHKFNEEAKKFRKWTRGVMKDIRDKLIEEAEFKEHQLRKTIDNMQQELAKLKTYSTKVTRELGDAKSFGKDVIKCTERFSAEKYNDCPKDATPKAMAIFYINRYRFEYVCKHTRLPMCLEIIPNDVIEDLAGWAENEFRRYWDHINTVNRVYRTMDKLCEDCGFPKL